MLVPSLVAFAIVLATDILYVTLINSQQPGDPAVYVPRFVASYLAVMAALIGVALVPAKEVAVIRFPMRSAAAGGLLALGIIAAFSIGLPLVIAGSLVGFALARTVREPGSLPRWSGVVVALLAVAVLIGGFEVTQRLIVCPETGTMGGGGSGFVTGPYHYQCVNGQLNFQSG